MFFFRLLYFFGMCSFRIVFGVPASSDSNNCENLASEVATVKNTMKVLSDQWDKWNTLFITSLEPRITSTASTLSSIDSNIHNLQERAHVWDTFQLHVAAWNDQLAALDRKMAILSKGMEQVLVIDNKLNTVLSAEYKIETLINMVNSLTESILNIKQFCKSSRDSLLEEFAVRGILGSLKLVERKVDKLLMIRPSYGIKAVPVENTVKCNIPKPIDDLLNDISSKVDIIFDSVYKKNENDYPEDYLDVKDTEGSGSDPSLTMERLRAVKRGVYFSKNSLCCKSTDQGIKDLQAKVSNIEKNLPPIIEANHVPNIASNLCYKSDLEEMLRNFKHSLSVDQTVNMNLILESYFNEHRTHLSSMLERFSTRSCRAPNISDLIPTIPTENDDMSTSDITEKNIYTSMVGSEYDSEYDKKTKPLFPETSQVIRPAMTVNKSSCDNLDYNSSSGVYIFENGFGDFLVERFFNKHYCEVRDDGFWTVIQSRDNYSIQHDFNVSWNDYKLGFGDLNEDFWIGNNYLSGLSKIYNLTLRIELGDFDGNEVWAEYKTFSVDSEENQFKLTIAGYSGNSSDALSSHNGALFSTYDRKNDEAPECCPCSVSYGGGWWFTRCFESNLNGIYYRKPYENDYFRGVIWEHWLGNYSLRKSRMMIKSTGVFQFSTPNITRIEDP